jgi:hypothetical protein
MTELVWLVFTLGGCVYLGALLASFLAWLMLGL